jgi:acyl-homoserine lactone acylase PvdQ
VRIAGPGRSATTAPAATASSPSSNSGRRCARAITAGGESGHPGSPHFNDEAERYTTGNLRTVYFWPEQLKGHVERAYHPGM